MEFLPRVLFEDNHLLVVNKRPSEIVQGDKTGDLPVTEFYKSYLKEKYNKPGNVFLGVVHRLDRPVSGVLVMARTSKGLARMNEVFRSREVRKIYWAIVKNCPKQESSRLVHFMKKDEKTNKSKAFAKEVPGSKRAELEYKVIAKGDNYCLLEIELFTGRHHQIRSQLSAIGSPIKGDLKYGSERSNEDGSICLHARKVIFEHPVKKEEITVVAPVPEDNLWTFLENMVN